MKLLQRLENNPRSQYRFHKWMAYFWLINMAVVVGAFSFLPAVWKTASVLYLVLVSLYANFATDYGAMSAAEAAQDYTDPPGFDNPKEEGIK
jgi:hypothetical protein